MRKLGSGIFLLLAKHASWAPLREMKSVISLKRNGSKYHVIKIHSEFLADDLE